jgi:hypothetical protein
MSPQYHITIIAYTTLWMPRAHFCRCGNILNEIQRLWRSSVCGENWRGLKWLGDIVHTLRRGCDVLFAIIETFTITDAALIPYQLRVSYVSALGVFEYEFSYRSYSSLYCRNVLQACNNSNQNPSCG